MLENKQNRRGFLRTIVTSAAAASVCGLARSEEEPDEVEARRLKVALEKRQSDKRPNIIYIMLDEWGYFEMSCMGNEKLKTPNIDRMVGEGMRFTHALAGGSVCAPTRSTLMTGQHTGHTTVRANGGGLALRASDVTVAEVLKGAGYATGGFGKWGIGDRGTTGVPEKHGFNTFFGYYHQVHAHSYYPRYLLHNSEKVVLKGNTGDYYEGKQFSQTLIFNEAMKFIDENRFRPFFCYCPWTPPHGLWGFPKDDPAWKEYKDKPWTAGQQTPNDAKVYAAMLSMVDRQIGEIFARIKELKIDENTLVILCGDNGGQPYFPNGDPSKPKPQEPPFPHGFFGPNLNPKTGERFRGGKGNFYEGGLRIPMIARWPGKVQAGAVNDHVWYFPDVMPTLAELAGVAPSENTDGLSITPVLLGAKVAGRSQRNHKFFYWEMGGQVAVRAGSWKAVRPRRNAAFELYNLKTDIEEKTDMAQEQPEVLKRLVAFAEEAHTPNKPGSVLDKNAGFQGQNAD